MSDQATAVPATPGTAGSAFARGALLRGAGGALFAVAAFALVAAVELAPLPAETAPRIAQAVAASASTTRALRVESTFAVASWSVTAAGAPVGASRSDDGSWSGSISGGELVVTAEPVDQADGRVHALRLRIDGAESVVWGSGAVTAVVPASP